METEDIYQNQEEWEQTSDKWKTLIEKIYLLSGYAVAETGRHILMSGFKWKYQIQQLCREGHITR